MEKSVQITLIIAAAVVLLALVGVSFFYNVSGNTISVNGNAVVKAVPDLVSVYFNIETNASTAEEAKNLNANMVDDITTAVIRLGFERKDITTENFNIYPDYSGGYKVSYTMKIQLASGSTERIGKVIDAGVDNGALISYINFELSQSLENEYKADALKQATQDAEIKASSIASGLGKKLGRIVSVTNQEFNYNPWPIYANNGMVAGSIEAKQAVTDIQPGQQDITAYVSAVYRIV